MWFCVFLCACICIDYLRKHTQVWLSVVASGEKNWGSEEERGRNFVLNIFLYQNIYTPISLRNLFRWLSDEWICSDFSVGEILACRCPTAKQLPQRSNSMHLLLHLIHLFIYSANLYPMPALTQPWGISEGFWKWCYSNCLCPEKEVEPIKSRKMVSGRRNSKNEGPDGDQRMPRALRKCGMTHRSGRPRR